MKFTAIRLLFFSLLVSPLNQIYGCANLSASFNVRMSRSCGVPVTITLTNSSSGRNATVASYVWKLNNKVIGTAKGLDSIRYTHPLADTLYFRLVATDTGRAPCKDSITQMVIVSTGMPRIIDGSTLPTYKPQWRNCISISSMPDTFGIYFQVADTLYNFSILWGDGTRDTGSLLTSAGQRYHKYNSLGVFTMRIISSTGSCRDTLYGEVINDKNPVASLNGPQAGTNQGCAPLRVRFINNSSSASNSTRFIWDMGDSIVYTWDASRNKDTLYHTYTKRNRCNLTVSLRAVNQCGSSSTTWSPISVIGRNQSAISVTNPLNCDLSKPFEFNNRSLDQNCINPNARRFKWVWGDGTDTGWITSRLPLRKFYKKAGTYTILLIDSNSCGRDTGRYILKIDTIIRAKIGFRSAVDQLCAPARVDFADRSKGLKTSRSWNFGNPAGSGNTSSDSLPGHTYTNSGTYTVVLSVGNVCGTSRDTVRVRVRIRTKAGFQAIPDFCAPDSVAFINTSQVYFSNSVTYRWILPDGSTSNLRSPPKMYLKKTGLYSVRLITTDSCGRDSITRTFRVDSLPNVKAGVIGNVQDLCAPQTIRFIDLSKSVKTSRNWNFGNPAGSRNTSTDSLPSHTYTSGGTYTVVLSISNKCGTRRDTLRIRLREKGKAAFTRINDLCAPDSVAFINTSTEWFKTTTRYLWYLPDGSTSSLKNPGKMYLSKTGTYRVRLYLTDSCGTDSAIQTFRVDSIPNVKAAFRGSSPDICVPERVSFIDLSTSNKKTRSWNFGVPGASGNTSTDSLPSFTYTKGGNYLVVLTISNGCGTRRDTLRVRAGQRVKASFAKINNFCAPDSISLVNTSVEWFKSSTTYEWTLPDNTVVFGKSPGKFGMNRIGNYRVKLRAWDSCGIDSFEQAFKVDSIPYVKASYTGSLADLCSPHTIRFIDLTKGFKTTRSWNFGDPGSSNNTSSDSLPSHRYTKGGNYLAVLTITNSCGTRRDSIRFRIRDKVSTSFSQIPGGCSPYTATFTNTSKEWYTSGTTYKWIFHDGSTSSARQPAQKTYTAGTYRIRLIGYDSCGTDTFSQVFTVNPRPVVRPEVVSASLCKNNPVVFRHTSNAASNTIRWDYGDGKTVATFTGDTVRTHTRVFSAADTFLQTVFVTDAIGCRDTLRFTIGVKELPKAAYAQDKNAGCGPLQVSFSNTSSHNGGGTFSQLKFAWQFGPKQTSKAQDSTLIFTASITKDTSYPIKLIVTNAFGCIDSTSSLVMVRADPSSRFVVSQGNGCAPLRVVTENRSHPNGGGSISDLKFNWAINGFNTATGRDTIIVFPGSLTKDSFHTLRLVVTSVYGCKDTMLETLQVFPKPLAAFASSVNQGCRPLSVRFSNNSKPYDTGSIAMMRFLWNFGNSGLSTAQNPNSLYNDILNRDTNYKVTLIAVSEHDCKDTSSASITLFPSPVVAFKQDRTSGCSILPVRFTDETINGYRWKWDFGNGREDTSRNPFIHFSGIPLKDTTYRVKLKSVSNRGCIGDSAFGQVKVLAKPLAAFRVASDTVCLKTAVQFFNESKGEMKQRWDFGNGLSATTDNPIQLFNKSSSPFRDTTYKVRLIVSGVNNCTDTAHKTITILPFPIPRFDVNVVSGCSPVTVRFSSNSSNVSRYHWNFGDGATSSFPNPVHEYVNNGAQDSVFTVLLSAYFNDCLDTLSARIKVKRIPKALYSWDPLALCDSNVQFRHNSINTSAVLFDFGDGARSSQAAPKHGYNTSPTADILYKTMFIAFNSNGCTDTVRKNILIPRKLIIGMKDSSFAACPPLDVAFSNRTQGAFSYFWDFGDGLGSTQFAPVHRYTKPGTYRYKLTAYGDNGCRDSLQSAGTILVRETPEASFTSAPARLKRPDQITANFTDQSTGADIAAWRWNFGDPAGTPAVSSDQNPSHTFSDSGWFNIQLSVSNGFCADTVQRAVYVEPETPVADFDQDIVKGCPPLTVTFTNRTRFAGDWVWYFGDGTTGVKNADTVRHTFTHSDTFTVTLVSSGPGGRDVKIKKELIVVYPKPVASFELSATDVYLPFDTIHTMNNSRSDSIRTWFKYNDRQDMLQKVNQLRNAHFGFGAVGNYSIRLLVANEFGCLDSSERFLRVRPEGRIFVPNAFTPDGKGGNETFKPSGYSIASFNMRIYTRWGQKLFETNDINRGWDGTFNGKPCPEGVYVYIIDGNFISGQKLYDNCDCGSCPEGRCPQGTFHLLR